MITVVQIIHFAQEGVMRIEMNKLQIWFGKLPIGRAIEWAVVIAIVFAFVALSGCATKPTAPTVEDTIKAGIVDGAVAAAKAPLFKMTCPVTGCLFGSLEVGNPGGAAQMAEIVKVAMAPQPSEASQNFRAVIGVLGQVGTIGLVSHAAASIFGKISDGYVGIASKIQAPGAITTTTNTMNATTNTSTTSTLSGTGVLGSGTYTAPITNTTNPSPKVCTPTFSATGAPTGFVCSGG